jgi:hypothetical protein
MTEKREILPLPDAIRIVILQQIIMNNNAEMCRLQAVSYQCRDELLKLGAEAYPPFPKRTEKVTP